MPCRCTSSWTNRKRGAAASQSLPCSSTGFWVEQSPSFRRLVQQAHVCCGCRDCDDHLAGVFAVLQYVAPRGPSSPPTDTSSSTTHEPGAAPTQPPSRSAPAAVTVGTCLNGSVPVACDSDHNAEVISLDGQCDSGLFARYAGGNSSVEVFRSSITFHSI